MSILKINLRNVEYSEQEQTDPTDTMICSVDIGLLDVPVSLANAIRRINLSELPNVGLNEKDMTVVENVSDMHNQFITHRASMLPIYRNNQLKILCRKSPNTGLHEYVFDDDSIIPIFELDEHNIQGFTQHSVQDVMTSDFKVYKKHKVVVDMDVDDDPDMDEVEGGGSKEEEETVELPLTDFMKPDYYTNEFIHFYVLKSNPNNAQKGQKLNLIALPSVGQAKMHALYSPVGSVAFKYDKDTEEIQNEIFKRQIKQRNYERVSKGLQELTENEVDMMRRSFDRLDSARVYKQNRDGECNSIQLTIDSIGVYSPLQAFMDSLHVLEIDFIDLMNGIKIDSNSIHLDEGLYEFYFENNHAYIKLTDHGHTIGNLLTTYLNRLTLDHLGNFEKHKKSYLFKSTDTILEMATYRITHPLENDLLFKMKVSTMYQAQFADLYNNNTWDKTTLRMAPYAIMFYKASQYVVEHLRDLQQKFITAQTEQTMGVTNMLKQEHVVQKPSFRRQDDQFTEKLFYEN